MTADFPIVLDACVLANFGVCDLFLRLAETPRLLIPKWSATILDEVHRTQRTKLNPPWPEHLADSWRREVMLAFPDSCIEGYEVLLPILTNDPADRHVLAAAVRGSVSLIVTFNLRHFRLQDLAPWRVEAVHPQDYLLTLYSMHPAVVMAKVAAISGDRNVDVEDTLIHLGKSVPRFSRRLLEDLGRRL